MAQGRTKTMNGDREEKVKAYHDEHARGLANAENQLTEKTECDLPHITQIGDSLKKAIDRISSVTNRLEGINGRLFGTVGVNPSDGSKDHQPPCMIDQLKSDLQNLHANIDFLINEVDRIDSLT